MPQVQLKTLESGIPVYPTKNAWYLMWKQVAEVAKAFCLLDFWKQENNSDHILTTRSRN